MLNNYVPAIEGIGDATRARMMLYQGQRAVHAPLSTVRDVLNIAPYVADRTELAALDTSKDLAAFVLADRDQSQWVWDASDLSATLVGPAIASSAVDSGTNNITSVAHGLFNRTPVIATTTTADITANTIYFAIVVDDDNYQLATSVANAQAGTEIDLTVTTAITVKRHFDPYGDRVTVASGAEKDGSDGGYVAAGALSTGGHFTDDATPGRIGRFNGVMGIGDAAGVDMVRLHGNGNTGTWIDREFNENYTYIATNPQLAVGHVLGGTAITAYSRTSDSPGAGNDAYGITAAYQGFVVADKDDNFAWVGYDELVRYDGAGSAFVRELEMTNLGTTDMLDPKPYGTGSGSHVAVLALGSGGGGHIQDDGPITGTPSNFSNYMHLTKAGAVSAHEGRGRAGIVAYYNSLVRATPADETSDADVVRMARGHGLVWHSSDDVETARIRGFGGTSSRRQVLQFGTTATQILGANADDDEFAFLTVAVPSMGAGVGGNGITVSGTAAGGGAPIISATGSDTNLMVNVRGKGSSGVQLQAGDSTTKVQVTTTGLGFFGTTAIAKPTVTGSRGGNAALASLLTAGANLGLWTDSSS